MNFKEVAILILLELTLQSNQPKLPIKDNLCRNPYFIGINSAISVMKDFSSPDELSQSLFYWN